MNSSIEKEQEKEKESLEKVKQISGDLDDVFPIKISTSKTATLMMDRSVEKEQEKYKQLSGRVNQISGYLHQVSPMKTSTKSSYFNELLLIAKLMT